MKALIATTLFVAACGPVTNSDAGADSSARDVATDARDAASEGHDAPGDSVLSDTPASDTIVAMDVISEPAMDAALDVDPLDTGIDAPAESGPVDAGADVPAVDAGPMQQHVHIMIDNFCNTSASPMSIDVPRGQSLQITWHNHSVDYQADVWLSYGGGFLMLDTGASWADRFEFCRFPRPYDAYGDVSIAGGGSSSCPSARVMIHCL